MRCRPCSRVPARIAPPWGCATTPSSCSWRPMASGLRVVRLRLEDLDWRHQRLHVRQSKTGTSPPSCHCWPPWATRSWRTSARGVPPPRPGTFFSGRRRRSCSAQSAAHTAELAVQPEDRRVLESGLRPRPGHRPVVGQTSGFSQAGEVPADQDLLRTTRSETGGKGASDDHGRDLESS